MKFFLLFLLASFVLGILVWRARWTVRVQVAAAICVFVCIGYFFLHQI